MSDKKTILLAEDDMFIRDIYATRFLQDQYNVVSAENGIEALEKLKNGLVPDIILLDMIMPGMDGIEVLKKLKEHEDWKNIPVLMLTNISEREKVSETQELGVIEYLIKSQFTPSEVVQKVEILLAKKSLV